MPNTNWRAGSRKRNLPQSDVHTGRTIRRAGKGNHVHLAVDGKPMEGAVVPPPPGKTEVSVEVKLGQG